jgi:hypothetical protein
MRKSTLRKDKKFSSQHLRQMADGKRHFFHPESPFYR